MYCNFVGITKTTFVWQCTHFERMDKVGASADRKELTASLRRCESHTNEVSQRSSEPLQQCLGLGFRVLTVAPPPGYLLPYASMTFRLMLMLPCMLQ